MRNADLQSIVARFLDAAPAIIIAARQHTLDRSCMVCGASRGAQHVESCALWGLVAGRIDFHRLSDPRAKATGDESDTSAATMDALEQGGTFSQPSPTHELDFSHVASATREWWPA